MAHLLAALFLALVITAPSGSLLADTVKQTPPSRPPVPCDQSEGIGAVFHDFESLIIYYSSFPNNDQMPDPLKYEQFNERLLKEVKANFAACLQTASGAAKPIVVIPPPNRRGTYQQQRLLNMDRIHDPKNLTILVRVSYALWSAPPPPGTEKYGYLFYYFYRPDVSHKLGRIPLPNNSGVHVFFPDRVDTSLGQWLDGFFKSIHPRLTATDHPGSFGIHDMKSYNRGVKRANDQ